MVDSKDCAALDKAHVTVFINALLFHGHIPDGYKYRQTYLACHFLDILCELKCTGEQRKQEFKYAIHSIGLMLSENTPGVCRIVLKILSCAEILFQIEAFTIALIAGTIGRSERPYYTNIVAKDIVESSGIENVIPIIMNNVATSKVDQISQSEKVARLAISIEKHMEYDKAQEGVVNVALSHDEFTAAKMHEFAGIVFDPSESAIRQRFVIVENGYSMNYDYFDVLLEPLFDVTRLPRLFTFVAVLLAKKHTKNAANKIIASARALLIENFTELKVNKEEFLAFVLKIPTETNN